MAINLDDRYPGRANGKTLSYPQGSFKNRTSPSSSDGTYLEQDWANDIAGFLQSLMSAAGMTANGTVDVVGASQYFDALRNLLLGGGQTWQDLSGSRSTGATYTNDTGRTIAISVQSAKSTATSGDRAGLSIKVDDLRIAQSVSWIDPARTAAASTTVFGLVPPGSSYTVENNNIGTGFQIIWTELR